MLKRLLVETQNPIVQQSVLCRFQPEPVHVLLSEELTGSMRKMKVRGLQAKLYGIHFVGISYFGVASIL
jgi:hypothetical protein